MKKQNWVIELARFIESRRNVPFAWHENDCCTFVADAILLITGIDAAAPYRGHYTTATGAYRALRKYGDGTIAGAWSACFEEIPVSDLGRGDVALVNVNGLPASALLMGNKLWAVSKTGLITLPVTEAIKAWRVE
ncbi:DUF6950 family protein [Endozoicomonas lisbonensis]|uniref:DUF6950 domain-containing protein n=1 Tax=Endozoicomonas lisbonensis TaxID=3120522 RepID=A0ABV2SFI5_9GAMM